MFKKFFLSVFVLLAGFLLVACNGGSSGIEATEEGDTLVISVWDDDFIGRFRDFYPGYVITNSVGRDLLDDGTIVKWIQVANDDNAYLIELVTALDIQESASAKNKEAVFDDQYQ